MAYTAGFSVNVGDPTKASDVSTLAANDDFLKNAIDTFIANDANNRVLTGTGSGTANGEANLTFDGSTLALTGAQTISSTLGVTGLITANGGLNSNNVAITGGSISGITDIAVADGGTGASTASAARTNLGLGTIATQDANNVTITGGSATGLGAIGGTTGTFSGDVAVATNVFFVDASGSAVGIGTNSLNAYNSAHRALELGTRGANIAGRTDADTIYVNANSYQHTDGNWKYDSTDEASQYYQTGGTHNWRRAASGTAGTNISWTTQATLDATGFGVGTASPSALIHAEAADGAANGAIKYTATGVASGYLSASPDGTVLATDTAGISFRTGITGNDPTDTGSTVMTILSGGDVGLGTQSPEIRLSVTDTYNGSALTSNDIPAVQIINEQGSYTADNVLGVLGFGKSQGFASGVRAGMVAHYSGTGSQSSNVGAYLSFRTSADAAGDSSERLRINSNGTAFFYGGEASFGTDSNNRGIVNYGSNVLALSTVQGGTTYYDTVKISNGDVGIGSSPSSVWGSSFRVLQLGSQASINVISSASDTNHMSFSQNAQYDDETDNRWEYITTNGYAANYYMYQGSHNWRVNNVAGTAGNEVTWNSAMTLTNAGLLGVGTQSPTAALSLQFNPLTTNGFELIDSRDTDEKVLLTASEGTFGIYSTTSGTSGYTERFRVTSAGTCAFTTADINVLFNGTTSSKLLTDNNGVEIYTGGYIWAARQATSLYLSRSGAAGEIANFRYNAATAVGSISVTSSATAFNTSSDYRLKENLVPITGAVDRVNALQPRRFNFINSPDITVDGFLAHEVSPIVPEAITGEKDAVDEKGEPEYQGIDQSKLVPLLTAAIQELTARIEALEAA